MNLIFEFLKNDENDIRGDLFTLLRRKTGGSVVDISLGDINDVINDYLPLNCTNEDLVSAAQKSVIVYTMLMNMHSLTDYDHQGISESLDSLKAMCESVQSHSQTK
jgi:hypothetical protein